MCAPCPERRRRVETITIEAIAVYVFAMTGANTADRGHSYRGHDHKGHDHRCVCRVRSRGHETALLSRPQSLGYPGTSPKVFGHCILVIALLIRFWPWHALVGPFLTIEKKTAWPPVSIQGHSYMAHNCICHNYIPSSENSVASSLDPRP